jgi:hypothetical protein
MRLSVRNIDQVQKLNFVRTSAYTQAGNAKDQQFGEYTCVGVFKINDARQIIAHSSLEPAPSGGVQFRRTVSKDGRVRVDDSLWIDTKFSEHYSKMSALEARLDKLIQLIKPSEVPFGWYNPWQDTYHRSSSAAALATTTEPAGPLTIRLPPDEKS